MGVGVGTRKDHAEAILPQLRPCPGPQLSFPSDTQFELGFVKEAASTLGVFRF